MKKTILLIEDNFYLRQKTTEILRFEGYNMLAALNGEEGVALAKEKKPDIILCDIKMSGINGYEVLEQLKQNKITAGIPFVFLSASFEKKDVQDGLDMGAVAFIAQPFRTDNLLKEIKRSLVCQA